ncbi:hypothetical protein BDZ89DRAFT_1140437 [Hymenopellis radicata]|nr:hypothetical protein BDZ89DRAFT_1140437 [Hymenopellis radicata]
MRRDTYGFGLQHWYFYFLPSSSITVPSPPSLLPMTYSLLTAGVHGLGIVSVSVHGSVAAAYASLGRLSATWLLPCLHGARNQDGEHDNGDSEKAIEDSSEGKNTWEVGATECLVGVRVWKGKLQYRCAWWGWGRRDWSWQSEEDLDIEETGDANEEMKARLWEHLTMTRKGLNREDYDGKVLHAKDSFYNEEAARYHTMVKVPTWQAEAEAARERATSGGGSVSRDGVDVHYGDNLKLGTLVIPRDVKSRSVAELEADSDLTDLSSDGENDDDGEIDAKTASKLAEAQGEKSGKADEPDVESEMMDTSSDKDNENDDMWRKAVAVYAAEEHNSATADAEAEDTHGWDEADLHEEATSERRQYIESGEEDMDRCTSEVRGGDGRNSRDVAELLVEMLSVYGRING